MDVHAKSTVWCLLDAQGQVVREGRVATSAPALGALVRELSSTFAAGGLALGLVVHRHEFRNTDLVSSTTKVRRSGDRWRAAPAIR
jgi:hypothetical protein